MGFREYFIEKCEPALFEPVADAKGEKRFIAKHKVQQHKDPEGNGPDVFQGSKVKTYDRSAHRMGNDAQQSLDAYEDWDHGFADDELELICDNITVEEFEQLDELSRKTLVRYMQKSSHQMANLKTQADASRRTAGDLAWHARGEVDTYDARKKLETDADKKDHKFHRRVHGQFRAGDRLAKEETDLQELSKHTLVSYANKAALSSAREGQKYERGMERGDAEYKFKAQRKLSNRVHGITKAAGRLAYTGGHAMSSRGAPSGITVREGKSYKDLRKHFSDSDQTAIKKRFQQRMQARRGDEE